MVSSYYSRRSTLVGLASIVALILVSFAFLYNRRVDDFSQPSFPYNSGHGGTDHYANTEVESSLETDLPEDTVVKPVTVTKTVIQTATGTADASLALPTGADLTEICASTDLKNGAARSWKFDPARDSVNYGLDDEQCNSAFPDLYHEIDRARKWRMDEGKGNITEEDVDIGWREFGVLRVLIYDRQLFIVESKCIEVHGGQGGVIRYDIRRAIAMLGSIHRAITAFPGKIPNIEFSMSVEDIADEENQRHTVWTMTRRDYESYQWLVPDFGYWSWDMDMLGSYQQVRQEMADKAVPFEQKKPTALWRGANLNKIRSDLLNVSANKPWSEVEEVHWGKPNNHFVRMADHCLHQYLIQTEGNSYSGRGKYLLNCNSVVIMHKRMWLENFEHLMIGEGPNQNVVFVRDDFADLPEVMDALLKEPTKGRKIAENAAKTFRDRYLTPAAQACYWRRLFKTWSEISFEPKLYDDDWKEDPETGEYKATRRFRGVPYETYITNAYDRYITVPTE
ncbi:MAG: hypothetical protein M1820_001696 [Bogoriella megaspora]|nr:MAG: hypothetical protein M1820_001696 [Bogoriella megaspora]